MAQIPNEKNRELPLGAQDEEDLILIQALVNQLSSLNTIDMSSRHERISIGIIATYEPRIRTLGTQTFPASFQRCNLARQNDVKNEANYGRLGP
jgi:hypothetical protein